MSRRVWLSAVSVILLPGVLAFLAVRAASAPPGKRPPPKPAAAAPPAAKPPAARPIVAGERAILKALRQPTNFEFKDTPLKDVVEYLQSLHGIPIQLDKNELEKASKPIDTPVTKNLKGISLRSALKLLLDELELKFVIHNEVLLITTPEMADSEKFLITKVYDVADLIIPYADHSYRGNQLFPSRPAPESFAGGTNAPDFQSLMDLITSTVQPKTWDANGGPANIAPFPGQLAIVLSQNREVHEQIADLLAQLRAKRPPIVVVDLQWLWLPADQYRQLIGGASAAGRVSLAVDPKLLDEVARKAAGFRGRIICPNGQRTYLASGDRRSVTVGAIPTPDLTGAWPQGGSGPPAPMGVGSGSGGSGMFAVPDPAGSPSTAHIAAGGSIVAQAAAAPPRAPTVFSAPTPPAQWPVIDVPNVGVVVEVVPVLAHGANTAILDVRSTVTRWSKPSPPVRVGSGSLSCPVDRPNMPAAQIDMTASVPLGKPVLLGAVTFAPTDGAGLEKPSDNPVQLCLIATTRIAEATPKLVKKK